MISSMYCALMGACMRFSPLHDRDRRVNSHGQQAVGIYSMLAESTAFNNR